jgi:hypothetical protein
MDSKAISGYASYSRKVTILSSKVSLVVPKKVEIAPALSQYQLYEIISLGNQP